MTDAQKRCNAVMRSARITVEKNYAMVSNLFRICETRDGYKIAKERPYAIEQLRVCTLLTNCYVCMNGDVVGSDNTFGLISDCKIIIYCFMFILCKTSRRRLSWRSVVVGGSGSDGCGETLL